MRENKKTKTSNTTPLAIILSVIISSLYIAFLIPSVSASTTNVHFNGVFENGTTLYSNPFNIADGYIYGRDVYKIRSTIAPPQQICTLSNITYKEPVCILNVTATKSRIVRVRHGNNVTYVNVTRDIVKKKCHIENKTKEVQTCRTISQPIGCLNPSGIFTNQLELSNFGYSTDSGITWNPIPYFVFLPDRVHIISSSVLFRVVIPAICYPQYSIDSAITVEQ